MKHTRNTIRATLVVVVVATLAVVIAPQAFAAAPSATATLTGGPVNPAGSTTTFTFTITPSSRTLDSFVLTAPAGWQLGTIIAQPASGSAQIVGNTVTASGLNTTGSGSAVVQFSATACAGDGSWTYTAADTQGRAYAAQSPLQTSVTGSCTLHFLNQPTDAKKNEHITADPFDTGTADIQVELLNGAGSRLTTYPVTVTFTLATGVDPITGQALVSGGLNPVGERQTVLGVATFDGALSIANVNEPTFTSYSLKPSTTSPGPTLAGAQSNGFDVWETQCNVSAGCNVSLRGSNDLYTSPSGGDLSADQLPFSDLPTISCAGQTLIFADSVFVHEFTGSGTVFLKSHVTRTDMKKAANNGQAHVEWCVGLPFEWNAKGGPAVDQDTNGAAPLGHLFVGIAPACPNANPQDFAPCISRQYGDGMGGSYTEGYLPGDPVRRT